MSEAVTAPVTIRGITIYEPHRHIQFIDESPHHNAAAKTNYRVVTLKGDILGAFDSDAQARELAERLGFLKVQLWGQPENAWVNPHAILESIEGTRDPLCLVFQSGGVLFVKNTHPPIEEKILRARLAGQGFILVPIST